MLAKQDNHKLKVALFSPGSCDKDKKLVENIKEYLEINYQLDCCYQEDTYKLLKPQTRAEIMLQYLFDEKIKVLWAIRGGEGTADIIPYIDERQQEIKSLPAKTLLGFSDITALLIYFAQRYTWSTVHGAMAKQLYGKRLDANSERLTMETLFSRHSEISLPALQALNRAAHEQRIIEAMLCGGNLSMLNISVRDSWELNTTNKIVFLEDVNEKAHSVSRTLKYLQRIGLLQNIKALIFGDFISNPIGCDKLTQENNKAMIIYTIKEFANSCPYPVLMTNLFGHGKYNYPLVFNRNCRLQLGSMANLLFR